MLFIGGLCVFVVVFSLQFAYVVFVCFYIFFRLNGVFVSPEKVSQFLLGYWRILEKLEESNEPFHEKPDERGVVSVYLLFGPVEKHQLDRCKAPAQNLAKRKEMVVLYNCIDRPDRQVYEIDPRQRQVYHRRVSSFDYFGNEAQTNSVCKYASCCAKETTD